MDQYSIEHSEAYESCHVEITHDGVWRKLSVKRLTKTYRRYEGRLDADPRVSFRILNALKGRKTSGEAEAEMLQDV